MSDDTAIVISGRVTDVKQSHRLYATATIDIGLFRMTDSQQVEGTLELRGVPVEAGKRFGVRYGSDDADVVFLGSTVRLTLTRGRHEPEQ